MTKSQQLAREVLNLINAKRFVKPFEDPSDEVAELIRVRFQQVHNEAVDSTVIAENRKTFVRPEFID